MIKFDDASLFNDAKKHLVGGVNSPVRAFKGVGGVPVFVKRALGAHIFDHEDKRYIDYVGSWGPMILGHAHPDIVRAVQLAAANGLSFGAPTALESEVATLICARYGLDKIRFTSSGTEATMSAIRLARGYTGRDDIVKFEGCYHGHSDSLLVKAGSGMLDIDTQELGDCVGAPSSLGVPEDFAKHTRVLPYNDIEALERYFAMHGDSTACVIVEPIAGNMNMIIPSQAFHNTLRSLCTKHGVVLIFDEVMTGFRVGLKGASAHFGITPDLSTFGKIIGAGLPVGAFGGRGDIMAMLAPEGGVYQAGTLSGNPLAMQAALTMLAHLDQDFYDNLSQKTAMLCQGLQALADSAGVPFCTVHLGGMFGLFFTDTAPQNFAQVMQANTESFTKFFHAMLQGGVYLAPSAFEASFISSAHSNDDIMRTLDIAKTAFANLGK